MEPAYKIIGVDGREYGPASLEEVLAWVKDGRVAPFTQIWRSDLTLWQPAGALAELQSELGKLLDHPAPTGAVEFFPVGFWIRFLAYLIDQIVLSLPAYLLVRLAGFKPIALTSWPPTPEQLSEFVEQMLLSSLIGYLLAAAYFIPLTARFGASVGKMIFGARILQLDGSPIGWKKAGIRFLGTILSNLVCYVGYLMIGFRQDKRGLHDLIAGTRVVYRQ